MDISEVEAFARDLDDSAAKAILESRKVVKKGAVKVKDRLRREASGLRHAPRLPQAITFDVVFTGDEVVASIGPLAGGAGSLAFYYFGNSKVGPSLPDPMLAAESEAEVMSEWLGKVADTLG